MSGTNSTCCPITASQRSSSSRLRSERRTLSSSANCRRTPPAERDVDPLASVSRSSSTTSATPPVARWNAALAPIAPPPMMTTSARAGRSLTPWMLLPRHRHATYAAATTEAGPAFHLGCRAGFKSEGAHVRAVVFTGAGGNEVIRLDELPDPVPGSQELLVHVTHAGLNPADLSQREGSYPAPPGSPQDVPGLEVAGTVAACGAQVLSFKPGDRVFGLVGGGGLADRVVVHERCVAAVPDALDEPGAAAVPEAFITAHDAIRTQAGLRPGERLLVHGAAGGVGSAALQIGGITGARVLGTVRSADAAAVVREFGGEPITDEGFADSVLEATGGSGADVI